MRPVGLGRKNWLHAGSPKAGPKVAAILSHRRVVPATPDIGQGLSKSRAAPGSVPAPCVKSQNSLRHAGRPPKPDPLVSLDVYDRSSLLSDQRRNDPAQRAAARAAAQTGSVRDPQKTLDNFDFTFNPKMNRSLGRCARLTGSIARSPHAPQACRASSQIPALPAGRTSIPSRHGSPSRPAADSRGDLACAVVLRQTRRSDTGHRYRKTGRPEGFSEFSSMSLRQLSAICTALRPGPGMAVSNLYTVSGIDVTIQRNSVPPQLEMERAFAR